MIGIVAIIEGSDTPNSAKNFDFFKQLTANAEYIKGYRKSLLAIYEQRLGGLNYTGPDSNYGAFHTLQSLAEYDEEVCLYFISLVDGELVMFTDTTLSRILGIIIQEQ